MWRSLSVGVLLGIVLGLASSHWLGGNINAVTPSPEAAGSSPDPTSIIEVAVPIRSTEREENRTAARREVSSPSNSAPALPPGLPDAWIAGRVVDILGNPVAGAVIRARRMSETGALGIRRTSSASHTPDFATQRSSATGQFLLRGLLPGQEYQVDVRYPHPIQIQISRKRGSSAQRVFSNQEGLELVLNQHLIRVTLNTPQSIEHLRKVDGTLGLSIRANYRWDDHSGSAASGGSIKDEFYVEVDPEGEFQLAVTGEGIREATRDDVVHLGKGNIQDMLIDLEPARGKSSILLRLTDDRGRPVTEATIRPVENPGPRKLLRGRMFSSFQKPQSSGDGRFRLDGRFRRNTILRIDPSRESQLVSQLVEIEVPEEGELEREVILELGGQLLVRIRGEAVLRARSVDLRMNGEWLKNAFALFLENQSLDMPTNKLVPGELYESEPLPPGSYTLRLLIRGQDELLHEFTIVAGQKTEILIDP